MPRQEANPGSTVTDTTKLPKPAPSQRGGGTPQKSPAESDGGGSKAVPIRALHFDKLVRWPGLAGSFSSLVVGKPDNWQINTANICYADSIFEYKGRFCVNGQFWVPETAGALLSWEY